mmetsp:Transcript_46982/g.119850  ORF Transcript_46982/g.119850 Transcript_46982/m.119850 type:complete len:238 (-) Transcript_46982:793-1506(-)
MGALVDRCAACLLVHPAEPASFLFGCSRHPPTLPGHAARPAATQRRPCGGPVEPTLLSGSGCCRPVLACGSRPSPPRSRACYSCTLFRACSSSRSRSRCPSRACTSSTPFRRACAPRARMSLGSAPTRGRTRASPGTGAAPRTWPSSRWRARAAGRAPPACAPSCANRKTPLARSASAWRTSLSTLATWPGIACAPAWAAARPAPWACWWAATPAQRRRGPVAAAPRGCARRCACRA